MDKQDLMYAALAVGIILIVALVIKPLTTGEAIDLGLPVQTTPQETQPAGISTIPAGNDTRIITRPTTSPTPSPTPTPQPTKPPLAPEPSSFSHRAMV